MDVGLNKYNRHIKKYKKEKEATIIFILLHITNRVVKNPCLLIELEKKQMLK
jgi:hypothetical protein